MARLSLGLLLIAAISALLLFSDLDRRRGASTGRKIWKLRFVQMTNIADVEESEAGVRDALKESGLVEGKDYNIRVANAQGDMSNLPGLIDSAITDGADILVTFSSPTLQAAVQRAGRTPVVFNFVASPFAAGAGKNDREHLPNITGVYLSVDYDYMLRLVRLLLPRVRAVGTLFSPGEINSAILHARLVEAAKRAGLRLESMAANTSVEVNDAALALAGRDIDAIVQIPGNLTAVAFGGIARAARQNKLPVFCFQTNQVREGALLAAAADYHGQGKMAGDIVVKIVRGQADTRIPFQMYTSSRRLLLNRQAARELGIEFPADLVKEAAEVVGR